VKKRLRKKLHKGEFTVFGFHVEFLTKETLAWTTQGVIRTGGDLDGPGTVFSEALDAWAHERGWCFAPGGDGKRWSCFVVPDHRRESKPHPGFTEGDREKWNRIVALGHLPVFTG